MPKENKLIWYQNKTVSLISFIFSIISICSLIVTLMWYGKVVDNIAEDIKWLKDCQIQQIELNGKYNYIIEHNEK